jgi:hypothetical protein
MRYRLTASIAVVLLTFLDPARAVTIGASSDITQPITSTNHSVTGPPSGASTSIVADIAHDLNSGPWHKNLINNGTNAIPSGNNVGIQEVLTNTGAATWTGWNERVVTRTTINTPNDSPGFLFRQSSLALQADYGAGFVPLTQGPDYTVTVVPYSGPPDPSGNGQGWEEITIFLAPVRSIQTSNRLQINKQIFEVFLDGNLWNLGEAAEIAQYPIAVPEPASLGLAAFGAITLLARARRSTLLWR